MKVKIFQESAGNYLEYDILKQFYDGAHKSNNVDKYEGIKKRDSIPYVDLWDIKYSLANDWDECDVAVIMGSWKPERDKPHHNVRSAVVRKAPLFICIETPLLGRKMFEENVHQRVGINGFLNNQATFYPTDMPSDRFNNLDIGWNGWKRKEDGHILLMLQLPGDASLRGMEMFKWAAWAINEIRKHSDKKIIVRTHPGHNPKDSDSVHKFVADVARGPHKDIEWSIGGREGTTLQQDLKGASVSISYTSGSAIDSVLAGIPTITCDPGNMAYDISSKYIRNLNNPHMETDKAVKQWLYNLAYSQWTHREFQDGTCWKHLQPMIKHFWNQMHTFKRKK